MVLAMAVAMLKLCEGVSFVLGGGVGHARKAYPVLFG